MRLLEDLAELGDGCGSTGAVEPDGVLEVVLGVVDVEERVVDSCHARSELQVTDRVVIGLVVPNCGVERGRGIEDLRDEGPVEADNGDGAGLEVTVVGGVRVSAVLCNGDEGVDVLLARRPRVGSHRSSWPSVRIRHWQRGHQE